MSQGKDVFNIGINVFDQRIIKGTTCVSVSVIDLLRLADETKRAVKDFTKERHVRQCLIAAQEKLIEALSNE
jgi:hypothetical protein